MSTSPAPPSSWKPCVADSGRYPSAETLLGQAAAGGQGSASTGLETFVRPDRAAPESLAHDAGLSPSTDDEVVGVLQATRQPSSDRGVVQGPSGDRGPARPGRSMYRAARTGYDRHRQHPLARPAAPQSADVGTAESCPPPTTEGGADDPRQIALRRRTMPSPPRPRPCLRARRQRREQRHTRHEVPRSAVHAAGVRRYHAWSQSEADSTEAFAFHRRAVKLLQSRQPPRTCGSSRRRTTGDSTSRRCCRPTPTRASS